MTRSIFIFFASLVLAACAQAPKQVSAPSPAQRDELHTPSQAKLPNVELDSELFYEFLLSEVAAQRGETGVAVEGSTELAKKTRDPRLAMRAAHNAIQSGQIDKAIEPLRIWQEADPGALMPTRLMASVLLRLGRIEEARAEFLKVLKADEAAAAQTLMQIHQMLASYPDKAAALSLMRELAAPYTQLPEAHWAVAQLAYVAGEDELALNEVRIVRNMRPEMAMAVQVEAQVLQKASPQQALEVLRRYLGKYPEASEVRLQYARALLGEKQLEESRRQFQRLAEDDPSNPDMAYAIALISLQLNDLALAEEQLQLALDKGKKEKDMTHYYLGQVGEARKNDADAIEHYLQVKGGEYHFPAQLRAVFLLNKSGRHAEARQHLLQVQPADNQQRIKLVQVEAHILRGEKRYTEAYQILQKNLEKEPAHPELLYETAMMAEKIDRHEEFERLMRKLIELEPDHAHAYNSLGYSLLERNERIPEAMELVQKAWQLAPDDAAIIDSVGWGYFRSGNLEESIKLLRRALGMQPDPEIAAHLGEVLWMRGEQGEARKVWQDSLKDNPDNEVLQAVMKRFIP